MNIVFTCGGTGGHIYPAIAVARMFRERQPDCKILFIGAEDGMENKIVPREGFRLETVKISNYQRRLTPAAIWHNLVTVPPQVKTIFMNFPPLQKLIVVLPGDGQDNARFKQLHEKRRAAVGEERERNAGGGQKIGHDANVEEGLKRDMRGNSGGKERTEAITRVHGDIIAAHDQKLTLIHI